MQANLNLIAERLRHQADVLDTATEDGPTELSAPTFLRDRAKAYDEAQYEMDKFKPYVHANILDPRPSRRLLLAAAILAGVGMGLLAYVFMAVHSGNL